MVYYPSLIDNDQTLPPFIDGHPVQASNIEKLRQAVLATEKELGIKPSGTFNTVRARLDALENLLANLQIIKLHRDLGGTHDQPKVIGIQGRPVSDAAPQQGEVLVWDGLAWVPAPGPGAEVNFAGDLEGGPISQTVIGINTIPVAKETDANIGQYLRLQASPFGFQTAIHFDGTYLWTKNLGFELYQIDPTVPEIVATVTLPFENQNFAGAGLGNTITSDSTHVYVSILANDGGVTGKLYVVEKATGEVVGLITAANLDSQNYIWGVAVHNDHIVVASGGAATFFSGNPNNTQIDRYSKAEVLDAFPSEATPNSTIPATPGESFRSNMVILDDEGTLKIYVNGYSNGKIYEVIFNGPGPLSFTTVWESGGVDPVLSNMAGLNNYLWVGELTNPAPDSPTNNVYRFLPGAFGFGPITNTQDAFGFHMAATNSTMWAISYQEFPLYNVPAFFSIMDSAGTLISNPGNPPITYLQMAYDGEFMWACQQNASGLPGLDAFVTEEAEEEFDHFFGPSGGNISLIYDDAGGAMNFQNEGSPVGTATTINAIGGTFVQSEANVVDLVISGALPPPGNAYDHLRLIPGSIFANPKGLYYDCLANRLWVTNGSSNQVVKLDVTGGNPVVDTIITLPNGNKGWKIVGDTQYVYVTTQSDGYVFIIDKSTNEVVGKGFCGGGSACTGIAVQNIDGTNYIWVVGMDFSGGSVHQFNADLMIANYPTAEFPIQSAPVPDLLSDWEDMCWVGGEGGYLVTGSAGYIYQFASENDGGSTLFGGYGNNPGFTGVQIGSVAPISYSGAYRLWTTALGSQMIANWGAQTLDNGWTGSLNLDAFTGDIISDGFDGGNLWVTGQDGLLWRIDASDSNNPVLIATISVPVLTDSNPFVGMAYDQNNNLVWMADPGHNAIVSVSTLSDTYVSSFAGDISPAWAKGDVVFDSPFSKTNIVSTKINQSPISPGLRGQLNFSETDSPNDFKTQGNYTTIFGGLNNVAQGDYNIILGGRTNAIQNWDDVDDFPQESAILSGADNIIRGDGQRNVIVGGEGHFITASSYSVIGGGHGNIIGDGGTITIAGGNNNSAAGSSSFVGGGSNNHANATYSIIGGGLLNHAYGEGSIIVGGIQNDAIGDYSFIGGGSENRTGNLIGDSTQYSYITGGRSATTARYAQMSHAGGTFNINFPGDAQFCRVIHRGIHDGSSITLLDDLGGFFLLEDDKTYAIRATCVLHIPGGGSGPRAMHVHNIFAHCEAGVATVEDAFQQYSASSGGDASTMSYVASGNTIVATVDNATNGSYAVLTYEWTEVGSH